MPHNNVPFDETFISTAKSYLPDDATDCRPQYQILLKLNE